MWKDAKVAGESMTLDQMLQVPEVFYGRSGRRPRASVLVHAEPPRLARGSGGGLLVPTACTAARPAPAGVIHEDSHEEL